MPLRFAEGLAAFFVSAVGAAGLSSRVTVLGLTLAGMLLSGCGTGAR